MVAYNSKKTSTGRAGLVVPLLFWLLNYLLLVSRYKFYIQTATDQTTHT
jgi:hypothetical protein